MTNDPPNLTSHFGRLRFARESFVTPDGSRLTSPAAAAAFFHWPPDAYKHHEAGLRQKHGFKVETAARYARAFGVNVAWLTNGVGQPFLKRPEPTSPPPVKSAARKEAG